jgi:hypothetical protein
VMGWSQLETEPIERIEFNVNEGSESIIPELNKMSVHGNVVPQR